LLFVANIDSPCPFFEAQMSCTTEKCVVTEADHIDLYKDWVDGTSGAKGEMDLVSSMWIHLEDLEDQAIFTDLYENPEAYTGYKGNIFWWTIIGADVWKDIYEENWNKVKFDVACSEEKLLYRLVSGMQTSINMHITHFFGDRNSIDHYPSHLEFHKRVGSHKLRIENLYMTYAFILSAYQKLDKLYPNFIFTQYNATENTMLAQSLKDFSEKLRKSGFIPMNMSKPIDQTI